MFSVTSPVNNEVLSEYPTLSDDEVIHEVEHAAVAYEEWSEWETSERSRVVHRIADVFERRTDELANIMTREMGKLPSEARGEMSLVVSIFRYYANNAEALLHDETISIEGGTATIKRRPTGVILGIMPWNFPQYQVARFAAPNLVLGNTMVLKHAPNCPESALAIVSVFEEAGLPAGVYNNLLANPSQMEMVIEHPAVQGVSLTGSERAGKAVAGIAGRNLKKTVLELGGNDPLVVLDSSNIAETARTIVAARLSNAGQACNAPKRIIALDPVFGPLRDAVIEEVTKYTPGDPSEPGTNLAPLSSRRAAEEVVRQLNEAVNEGATLHLGGKLVSEDSAAVTPAVLTDVSPGTAAYSEEIFGPVVILYRAADPEAALTLANDSQFGLGSSVFSDDLEKARAFGGRIEAGMSYVNQAGGSQADMPFGGIKRSGIGRELGALGIDEFANRMTVKH